MQRVKTSTAVVTLPADPGGGTPGYFANPNPGGGVPATVPNYEWYNNIQEELVSVIAAASIALDGSNRAQLLAALNALYLAKAGGTLSGALNEAAPATIASAGTVNIGAAASNNVIISGTTTITAFDTIAAGARRKVRFSGALTLTHNAASLILPGAANIATAANDEAEFVSLGAGNWKCVSYQPASVALSNFNAQTLAANGYQKLPGGLIIQWGTASTNASGVATFTYPITFPTGGRQANVSYNTGGLQGDRSLTGSSPGTSSMTAYLATAAGVAVNAAAISFIVIGN